MSDLTYMDALQRANADDVAFYPREALVRALSLGQVMFAYENGEPAGYLWHGPVVGGRDVRVYQAAIDYGLRRRYLGYALVADLMVMARVGASTGIRLRCASSSESNEFWRAVGFACIAVDRQPNRRGRHVNVWRADVLPGLFGMTTVEPSDAPGDRSAYDRARRAGVPMRSRFARERGWFA